MTQNIYDDPDFFAGYSALPRSIEGLEGAGEWPELRALLPTLAGADVVDLGCGFGWFCRWARTQGAESVLGLDLSRNMLARAAADTVDPRITYRHADLDEVELPADSFDLAYSSLTLHYLRDLPRLVAQIASSLRPGGTFVASVEHPAYTAPTSPAWTTIDGRDVWPLDGYLREGPRVTDWLAPGVVKQHRTIGTYFATILEAGLMLTSLVEWGPSDEDLVAHPDWVRERDRSPFLLLAARRGRQ
jgi:SAM-dependent methyltransferase